VLIVFCALQHIKNFYNKAYSARRGENLDVTNGTSTTAAQGSGLNDMTLTFLWSLTTTLFVIGGMIGAFSAGILANRVGRQVFLSVYFILFFVSYKK